MERKQSVQRKGKSTCSTHVHLRYSEHKLEWENYRLLCLYCYIIYAPVMSGDIAQLQECNIIPWKNVCTDRRTNSITFYIHAQAFLLTFINIWKPINSIVYFIVLTLPQTTSSKQRRAVVFVSEISCFDNFGRDDRVNDTEKVPGTWRQYCDVPKWKTTTTLHLSSLHNVMERILKMKQTLHCPWL